MGEEGLVCVYESNGVEAEMVRSLLEGSDIRAVNVRSGTGSYPVAVGAMGGGRVMVAMANRDRALDVIATAGGGRLEVGEPGPTPRRWLVEAITAVIAIGLVVYLVYFGLPTY